MLLHQMLPKGLRTAKKFRFSIFDYLALGTPQKDIVFVIIGWYDFRAFFNQNGCTHYDISSPDEVADSEVPKSLFLGILLFLLL